MFKTDRNQAKQKAIVGLVVGLVKKQNQESPKTLGLQRVVYFLQCRLNSQMTASDFCKVRYKMRYISKTENKQPDSSRVTAASSVPYLGVTLKKDSFRTS